MVAMDTVPPVAGRKLTNFCSLHSPHLQRDSGSTEFKGRSTILRGNERERGDYEHFCLIPNPTTKGILPKDRRAVLVE